MKYFDKELLDNATIERIESNLNSYQEIVQDSTILDKYKDFYQKAMDELLEYYYERIERPIDTSLKLQDDFPF